MWLHPLSKIFLLSNFTSLLRLSASSPFPLLPFGSIYTLAPPSHPSSLIRTNITWLKVNITFKHRAFILFMQLFSDFYYFGLSFGRRHRFLGVYPSFPRRVFSKFLSRQFLSGRAITGQLLLAVNQRFCFIRGYLAWPLFKARGGGWIFDSPSSIIPL